MPEQIKGWLTRNLGVVPNPSFVRARSTLLFGQKYPQKSWGFKSQIENWRGKRGKSKIGDYGIMLLTCKALTIMKPRTCVLIHVIFSYKTTTSAHPPCVKPEQVLLWLALFMLCNMALTFTFVHEILKCNHWNLKAPEQHFPVVLFTKLSKVVLTFESVDEILEWRFKWKLLSNTFLWYCLFCYTRCF